MTSFSGGGAAVPLATSSHEEPTWCPRCGRYSSEYYVSIPALLSYIQGKGGRWASLPSQGLVDTLAMGTRVDLVGYGVQNFVNGGGPCGGPCKKQTGAATTRFFAPTTLIASGDSISGEFIKLHSNKGGTCFGDSGGPNLLGGTNVVIGVNSFVANAICSGNTYSYRTDTTQALNFITTAVREHGGNL